MVVEESWWEQELAAASAAWGELLTRAWGMQQPPVVLSCSEMLGPALPKRLTLMINEGHPHRPVSRADGDRGRAFSKCL